MKTLDQRKHDGELLRLIEAGDLRAMAALYDRHAMTVYSVTLQLLCDSSLAEQMVSNIFIEIWCRTANFMQFADSFSSSISRFTLLRSSMTHLLGMHVDGAIPESNMKNQELSVDTKMAVEAIRQLNVNLQTPFETAPIDIAAELSVPHEADRPGNSIPNSELSEAILRLADTGLEVVDIQLDPAFARRRIHQRDFVSDIAGMNRLARVFLQSPGTILQELATAAVELCGADSAGISIELPESSDEQFYHWVATAGQYSGFIDAKLPRFPSACGVTLERGRPQVFRVSQRFFDMMGIQAPTVTDGLLLPWNADETRGTIWIMAHGRQEAFDAEDCRIMEELAKFAATGVRLEKQQRILIEQVKVATEVAMVNKLAHEINNPLQGLMQTVFLCDTGEGEANALAKQAMTEIVRLSDLVNRVLSVPHSFDNAIQN